MATSTASMHGGHKRGTEQTGYVPTAFSVARAGRLHAVVNFLRGRKMGNFLPREFRPLAIRHTGSQA